MDMDPAKILASVLFFRVLGFTSCSSSYLTLSRSTFVDTFSKNQLTVPPPFSLADFDLKRASGREYIV